MAVFDVTIAIYFPIRPASDMHLDYALQRIVIKRCQRRQTARLLENRQMRAVEQHTTISLLGNQREVIEDMQIAQVNYGRRIFGQTSEASFSFNPPDTLRRFE